MRACLIIRAARLFCRGTGELEERQAAALWGGRPAGPAAAGAPESAAPALPPGGRGCGVRLEHSGHNLIEVIKVLRAALPGLSLKDAKNLVRSAAASMPGAAERASGRAGK